jgi:Bacterial Ig-like domain
MPLQVTQGNNIANLAQTLLNAILGNTTGLSNIQSSVTGDPRAFGTFTGDPFGFGSGIVLSTGQTADVVGPNTDENIGFEFTPGDPVTGDVSVYDETILKITFDAAIAGSAFFSYVFGSEEFVEFAGQGFSDLFELKINGVDIAKTASGNAINVDSLINDPDFVNNTNGAISNETQLDGYTKPITFEGTTIAGANTIEIRIKDEGDNKYDSAVFIKGNSLGTVKPVLPTPPPAPTALDLATTSDDGALNTDDITSIGKPVISGKGLANHKVELFSDVDGKIGEAIADANGDWSITTSYNGGNNLLPGAHVITAKQTDPTTFLSSVSSIALSITASTADSPTYNNAGAVPAPSTPTLTAASDTGTVGDNITGDKTPTFSGTSAVLGGTIKLYSDGVLVGQGRVLQDGSWVVTSSNLLSGTRKITTEVVSVNGNFTSARSAEQSVFIENLSSAADLSNASDSGSSSIDNVTNVKRPTLTGTAEAGSTVKIFSSFAGGATVEVGTAIVGTDGTWSYTYTTDLLEGDYEFTTQATNGETTTYDPISSVLKVTTDYTKPLQPSKPDLTNASDNVGRRFIFMMGVWKSERRR